MRLRPLSTPCLPFARSLKTFRQGWMSTSLCHNINVAAVHLVTQQCRNWSWTWRREVEQPVLPHHLRAVGPTANEEERGE